MNTYHDVVVTGLDEETSEVVRPGICELVFTLNENPPPAWRELFRRVTHDRANDQLEHAQFRAGTVNVGVPGVCTTAIRLQKPPVREYCPPLSAPPASGWPMVPVT